jgi:hypothetical protein
VSKKPQSSAKPNPGWFRKGRSGNPPGRPTAPRSTRGSALDILLEKTFTVAHNGGTRQITTEEMLLHQTFRGALDGERMAQRDVVKWIMEREAWLAKNKSKTSRYKITLHSSPDPDNVDAALLLLGIAAANPGRAHIGGGRAQLLLEPWAAQAALRRRRGGSRLKDKERDEIRRCTRDPESLRWPRGTYK